MKEITKAKIYNLKRTNLVGLIYVKEGLLFLRTPSDKVFEVTKVEYPQMVDGVLQTTVHLLKSDGGRAEMIVGGEVDIARTLYNCYQRQGRILVEIEDMREERDPLLGEAFPVIKKLTRDEDERIDCAYLYKKL